MSRWNRNIDLLEGRRAIVYTKKSSPYKGEVFIGKGDIPCQATDENGDDVDGIAFDLDKGGSYIFSEDDIERVEFLD